MRGDAHAIANFDRILRKSERSADNVWRDARNKTAHKLVQGYVRREPNPMRVVNELLTDAQKSMDDFIAEELAKELDKTERIDRSIAQAEGRRNAALREIDRRRASLGERLRRSVQQIEHDELSLIETTKPANGKTRRLTSDRKIEANRANARASTGPKTAQGRARTARNALRHALSLPVCFQSSIIRGGGNAGA